MLIATVRISIVALVIGLLSSQSFAAKEKEGFPGRDKYPDIPYIELVDLYKQLKDVVIVDARSNYEYETLRIKGSLNIPVASPTFELQVRKLSNTTPKTIAFYCNGRRCMKSFIASKKAIEAGVTNVVAFDAGIFDWTKAYPKHAVLLGQSPVNPKLLIAKNRFKSKLLDPDKFSEWLTGSMRNSIVIDVRDKYQRAGVGFYPGLERWASLDDKKKLNRYIQKAINERKTLFIYDEVGKQVRWLQYALEKAGVKRYYFMEKGARAYYEMIAKLEWQ